MLAAVLLWLAAGYAGSARAAGYFGRKYPTLETAGDTQFRALMMLTGPISLFSACIAFWPGKGGEGFAFNWLWPLGQKGRSAMPTIFGGFFTPNMNVFVNNGAGYTSAPISTTTSSHSPPRISSIYGRNHDPSYPATFGWRAWRWDAAEKLLHSPQRNTTWHTSELRVEHWDESDVVRGVAGIHAEFVPVDWQTCISPYSMMLGPFTLSPPPPGLLLGDRARIAIQVGSISRSLSWCGDHWCDDRTGERFRPGDQIPGGSPDRMIHGIVERFGKYALGTEGWRAEIVLIKKLLAPSTEVGLQLEVAYPDVEVVYPNDAKETNGK